VGASQRTSALKGAAAVPAVQTGTAAPIRRYRAVLCCTGRSDRYSLTFTQVQGCNCAVLAVQTGTASSVRRYMAVLCCTGRSDRYSLTNPQVQDCTVLYWPFRQVQPHQSAGTGLYLLYWPFRQVQPHQSAGTELYCAVHVDGRAYSCLFCLGVSPRGC
jgi:hypothetical protein